jgi:hypothetical protein
MNRLVFLLATATILLFACASQPEPTPTSTPAPTITITPRPTFTPEPTFTIEPFRFIELKSGGFSLSIHPHLEFEINDRAINLSDSQATFIVSINGTAYIASEYTMESFLSKYVDEIAAREGAFIHSTPYEIEIDGVNGTAFNISGVFLDTPIAGKAFVISPRENFVVFGLGMSNLTTNKNEWAETGSDVFETLIASIKFKEEK